MDDAADALRLARECGYVWAERDALVLQADAHATLARTFDASDDTSAANRHRQTARRIRIDAEVLSSKLRLSEEDVAVAKTKAEAWLREWEKAKEGWEGDLDEEWEEDPE